MLVTCYRCVLLTWENPTKVCRTGRESLDLAHKIPKHEHDFTSHHRVPARRFNCLLFRILLHRVLWFGVVDRSDAKGSIVEEVHTANLHEDAHTTPSPATCDAGLHAMVSNRFPTSVRSWRVVSEGRIAFDEDDAVVRGGGTCARKKCSCKCCILWRSTSTAVQTQYIWV